MIVSLYDTLMTILPSPFVALNRAIAVAPIEGPDCGLKEVGSIADRERLAAYPFYSGALGDSSFDAKGMRGRASTSRQRSLWFAT